MGAYLSELLNAKGISTIHHDGVYDLIDGKLDRSKAYEFSEVGVRKILEENPSIEVVIDLHRDGVGNDTHLVTEANGKQAAKIMFSMDLAEQKPMEIFAYTFQILIFRIICRFSLQMQLASESMYPGICKENLSERVPLQSPYDAKISFDRGRCPDKHCGGNAKCDGAVVRRFSKSHHGVEEFI